MRSLPGLSWQFSPGIGSSTGIVTSRYFEVQVPAGIASVSG
jgi:hypothetical protein